jgi:hypothetical protein
MVQKQNPATTSSRLLTVPRTMKMSRTNTRKQRRRMRRMKRRCKWMRLEMTQALRMKVTERMMTMRKRRKRVKMWGTVKVADVIVADVIVADGIVADVHLLVAAVLMFLLTRRLPSQPPHQSPLQRCRLPQVLAQARIQVRLLRVPGQVR